MPQELQRRVAVGGGRARGDQAAAAAPDDRARGVCGRVRRAGHQPGRDPPLKTLQKVAHVALPEPAELHTGQRPAVSRWRTSVGLY